MFFGLRPGLRQHFLLRREPLRETANPLPAGLAPAASPAILPPSPFTFPQPPRNTPRGGVTLRPFAKTGVSHRRNTDVIPT